MSKNASKIISLITIIFFLGVSVFCWFKPSSDFSYSERRKLSQFPSVSFQSILSGKFMTDFEKYSLDQFPLRDYLRTLKAYTNLYIFRQSDNNDIYVKDGFASKAEYPLNKESVEGVGDKLLYVYNKYLKDADTKNYFSVIPDKNYFLADEGTLTLDYDEMLNMLKNETDFLSYIDILPLLSLNSFYKTDTHWRQEEIIPVAQHIANEMGVTLNSEYKVNTLDNDFYGVYHGQSALPLPAEEIKYLTNSHIENAVVFDYENNKNISVYDMKKAMGKDPYEMYLSGSLSLITIENKNASTDKELILFRDSFGSSIAPLFIEGYKKITVVDIRYIHPDMLEGYIEFKNQDVLFLYSTLVLNNSETIK